MDSGRPNLFLRGHRPVKRNALLLAAAFFHAECLVIEGGDADCWVCRSLDGHRKVIGGIGIFPARFPNLTQAER